MHREVVIACLPCLLAICVLVAVLGLLLRVSGAGFQPQRLIQLHRDQTGAVQSLSFVLTIPMFVILLLMIVQLSQLTIGRIVVEYAAYSAARAAIVWIPANLGPGTEQENRIGSYVYLGEDVAEDGYQYAEYGVEPEGSKFRKIHFAAAMACLPICPSRDVGSSRDHPGNAAAEALIRAYASYDPGAPLNVQVPVRLRRKLAYALNNTDVEIVIRHKLEEPELIQHRLPPYPEEFTQNEIGWQDQILVTVRHRFALLPGPGRLLARWSEPSASSPRRDSPRSRERTQSSDAAELGPSSARGTGQAYGPAFTYEMAAIARLGNEGEKPVLPYIQRTYGGAPLDYPYEVPDDSDGY